MKDSPHYGSCVGYGPPRSTDAKALYPFTSRGFGGAAGVVVNDWVVEV